jgi:hypothetical protein
MGRNSMVSFEAVNRYGGVDRSAMSSRDAALAWAVIIIFLVASTIGVILDRAATITP